MFEIEQDDIAKMDPREATQTALAALLIVMKYRCLGDIVIAVTVQPSPEAPFQIFAVIGMQKTFFQQADLIDHRFSHEEAGGDKPIDRLRPISVHIAHQIATNGLEIGN